MPVNTPSAYYETMLPKWTRCRDATEGSDAIKGKGTTYLPMVNVNEQSARQYDEYLFRAMWHPAMGRTIQGLTGAVFQKEIVATHPSQIDGHIKDITLAGEPLGKFGEATFREQLITGGYGILIDMATDGGRPYWLRYRREAIINVRRERLGGDEVLSRAVLSEAVSEADPEDPFATLQIEQFRVLELIEGRYTVTLWRKKDKNSDEWIVFVPEGQPDEQLVPVRLGAPLEFIPFVMPDDQLPPLDDLAVVNLSHYLSKADHENILHWVGYPFLWGRDLLASEGEKIKAGPSRMLVTGKDGHIGIIQATADGVGAMVEALDRKEKTMAMLGARLLEEQPRSQETATAVRMRHGGEHATLRTEAGSVEADLTRALQIHAWWAGNDATPNDVEASVNLNKDFLPEPMSPEMLKAALAALQSDSASFETFYYWLQRGEMARPGITFEEELAAIRRGGGGTPAPLDVGSNGEEEDE